MAEKRPRPREDDGGAAERRVRPRRDGGEAHEATGGHLRVATCCLCNMNRSMHAHALLAEHGFFVRSYGASDDVRIASSVGVRSFPFGTAYAAMLSTLAYDKPWQERVGIADLLRRNARLKPAPQQWQSDPASVDHDLVIVYEPTVYEGVLNHIMRRAEERSAAWHGEGKRVLEDRLAAAADEGDSGPDDDALCALMDEIDSGRAGTPTAIAALDISTAIDGPAVHSPAGRTPAPRSPPTALATASASTVSCGASPVGPSRLMRPAGSSDLRTITVVLLKTTDTLREAAVMAQHTLTLLRHLCRRLGTDSKQAGLVLRGMSPADAAAVVTEALLMVPAFVEDDPTAGMDAAEGRLRSGLQVRSFSVPAWLPTARDAAPSITARPMPPFRLSSGSITSDDGRGHATHDDKAATVAAEPTASPALQTAASHAFLISPAAPADRDAAGAAVAVAADPPAAGAIAVAGAGGS